MAAGKKDAVIITNVQDHALVPKHAKIPEEKVKEILARYNVTLKQVPGISIKDAALQELEVELGDVVEITRHSPTNEKAVFYRVVKNA